MNTVKKQCLDDAPFSVVDRFGQTVNVGDMVIVSHAPNIPTRPGARQSGGVGRHDVCIGRLTGFNNRRCPIVMDSVLGSEVSLTNVKEHDYIKLDEKIMDRVMLTRLSALG